ncbi:MAG: FG-GAP-like repeat-containing protein [Candidatus Sulfotelmatobacter sp.]|jgi:hypothetical protein
MSRHAEYIRLTLIFLFGFFLAGFVVRSADAQSFLYNYSAVSSASDPMAVIFEDFNGDGRVDLASLNGTNTVSIMLGEANAAFAPPVNYPIGNSPYAFIAADLRKNKKIDLITVNNPNGVDAPGTISVLLGNGDGTFAPHVDYDVGDYATGVVAGDFNDDGKIDLAVSNNFDNTISILYGNGDGTFQTQVVVDVASGPMSIATGDFNGDGKPDLIASCVGSGVVSVLLNDGNGNFTLVNSSTGLFGPDRSFVITGDFNGDGNIDAIISSQTQEQLYLLAGEGTGSFESPVALSKRALGEIYSLTAADINGDGKIDLAFGAVAPTGLNVMLGEGDGKFNAPLFSTIVGYSSIAFADVNGDGLLDVVTPGTYSSLEIALGDGKGQFGISRTTSTSGPVYGPNSTVAADFNGDGKVDLAIAEENFPTGQVSVVLGNGKGRFGLPIVSPLLSEAINNGDLMLSGDFNGDGKPDLIIMDDYSTGFQVLLGNGDGTFKAPIDTKLNTTLNFAVGDVNGDGKTDVVVSTTVNGQTLISIYLSNGDGTFSLGSQYTEEYGGPYVADVNGDGKMDLVFIGNPVFVMLGNGNGTFQTPITGPVLTSSSGAVIKDFNGDGKPDIVVGTYDGVAFLQGNGDGTFQSPVYSNPTIQFCCRMAAEDINGDGKLDLVSNQYQDVFAMLGNGNGTFQPPVSYTANGQVYSGNIVAGDFNSDGIGDIGMIFENASTGTIDISLYLSEPTYAVFPSSIAFGSVSVGKTSPPGRIALTNVGNGPLSLPSITVTGDFIERNDCAKKLAIGASCEIKVEFQPQSLGSLTGDVTITDNALATPQKVKLTGTGK